MALKFGAALLARKSFSMRAFNVTAWLLGWLILLPLAQPAPAETTGAPDILVLGDSQLSFGTGTAFVDLLGDMAGSCGIDAKASIGVIGVRSSTLTAWTGLTKANKAAICNVDPKWKVNAGVYGTLSQGENPYVQIGRGAQFQFCRAGVSPLEAVFEDGYYRPKLLILYLLGNAADRWAESEALALADVRATMADLPANQPCILMTTAPTYGRKIVALRQRAQDNLERAFAASGSRCSFVRGFTPETIQANMGNERHFRRKKSGEVKDPFHPTEQAARKFLALRRSALCRAAQAQLGTP
ncbi:MAG: SGNH/GDSL hydrolase family protein [Paracoccaceae bacterium]